MKNILKLFLSVFIISNVTVSCEDYLDVPPEANITENDVFGTYFAFQGFEDRMYDYIVDPNLSSITVGHNLTGETIARQGWNTSAGASGGNYLNLTQGRSNFRFFNSDQGIWGDSWRGIRRAVPRGELPQTLPGALCARWPLSDG